MTVRWVSSAAVEVLSFGCGATIGFVARRWRPYWTARNVTVPWILFGLALTIGAVATALVWRIGPPTELADPGPRAVELLGAFLSSLVAVSYTHLRAHETRHDLVCR